MYKPHPDGPFGRGVLVALALMAMVLGLLFAGVKVVMGAEPNQYLGLKQFGAVTGVMARCSLTGVSTAKGHSVWAGIGGSAFLDIIQIGAVARPDGSRRWFAAWGRGEPNAPGSAYTERDLGPADTLAHKYTVQLIGGRWALSIDGRTRATVPDTLGWQVRSAQLQDETEGTGDPLTGAQCSGARVYAGRWTVGTWYPGGSGSLAAVTPMDSGADWFRT